MIRVQCLYSGTAVSKMNFHGNVLRHLFLTKQIRNRASRTMSSEFEQQVLTALGPSDAALHAAMDEESRWRAEHGVGGAMVVGPQHIERLLRAAYAADVPRVAATIEA